MVAPLLAAGAAGAGPALDAGVKLATSVTGQLAAALGHPVLHRQVLERKRLARGGERVTTTEASLPAWLIAAGALAAVLIVREEMDRERWREGDPKLGRPWWWLPWWPWPPPDTGFPFG